MPIIQTLARITLWRRGPRDLPVSGPLVAALMLLYAGQSALQLAVGTGKQMVVADGIIDLVVLCAMIVALLAVTSRLHRLPQTLIAVLGVEILLAPLTIVLLSGVHGSREDELVGVLLRLAYIGLLVWDQLIFAHILRCALDASLAVGVLLAVGCALLSYAIMSVLFAAPAAAGA